MPNVTFFKNSSLPFTPPPFMAHFLIGSQCHGRGTLTQDIRPIFAFILSVLSNMGTRKANGGLDNSGFDVSKLLLCVKYKISKYVF